MSIFYIQKVKATRCRSTFPDFAGYRLHEMTHRPPRLVFSHRDSDLEGGPDGEQLDASCAVISAWTKPSEIRERQLDAHLPD